MFRHIATAASAAAAIYVGYAVANATVFSYKCVITPAPAPEVVNVDLEQKIERALEYGSVPLRILCAPQGYGKSHAVASVMRKLTDSGKISRASIVQMNRLTDNDWERLDLWFPQQIGFIEKRRHLRDYFDDSTRERPHYVVFDHLDHVKNPEALEDFLLIVKEIALRLKTTRFLVVTKNPGIAKWIRGMNGGTKLHHGV